MSEVTGQIFSNYFSPISELLTLAGVNNIFVNNHEVIQYEQFGETKTWGQKWNSESELNSAVRALANTLDQPIDEDEPVLDAVMPDGSRLNAVLPPCTPSTVLSIRVFPEEMITAEDLIKWGSLTRPMFEFLKLGVLCRRNSVVAGGTGAGKTTLVEILGQEIPKSRRLIIVEDTRELKGRQDDNVIRMEAPKRRDKHGVQRVTLGRLVINTLRQTPKALIVGEMRDPDAAAAYRTLLNTGHSGVITTLHADSAEDSIDRLRDLVQEGMPQTPNDVIVSGLKKALNIIVYCEETLLHGRRTTHIVELQDRETVRLFEWDFDKGCHVAHQDAIANSPIWAIARRSGLDLSWMDEFFAPFINA